MLLYFFILISQISCLKIPLHNFDYDAIPLALNPFITDKVTAAKKGYYGTKDKNATAESMGLAEFKDFNID